MSGSQLAVNEPVRSTARRPGRSDQRRYARPVAEIGDPVRVGERTMRNRTMHVAVNPGFAVGHQVGDRLFDYWRRRAEGGVGAIVSGLTPVHPTSVYKSSVLKNTDDGDRPALRRFAEAVSGAGALALVQLVHNGAQMVAAPGGPEPVSPSGRPVPGLGQPSRALTADEVRAMIAAFAAAAVRCRDAGVDGVEVHGAHGFLIHQFLSPLTNHRRDGYGGSATGRRRLARDVLRAVRDAVGTDLVVGFRLVADEFTPGGIDVGEALATARALAGEGLVDYLSVSAGNYGSLETAISPYPIADAPLVPLAAQVRAAVAVPVVAANRLMTHEVAAAVLRSGAADIVGLGRPLVADPDWPRARRVRPCIAGNACFAGGGVTTTEGIECAVNPDLALATERTAPRPAASGRFLVVGAGVAGLAFALEATRLGHTVTIREAGAEPGGQVAWYGGPLTGGRFDRYVAYAVAELADRAVTVECGHEVTADELRAAADGYDGVVLATGARRPAYLDLLRDPPRGATVLVEAADSGPESLQLAGFLLRHGCRVHVVTADATLGAGCETLTRRTLTAALDAGRATVHLGRTVGGPPTGPVLHGPDGAEPLSGVDLVVRVGGREPDRRLADAVPGLHRLGDCERPADIATATRSAYRLARALHPLTRR